MILALSLVGCFQSSDLRVPGETLVDCSNTRLTYLFTEFFESRNHRDAPRFAALWNFRSPSLQYVENLPEVKVDLRTADDIRRHVSGRFDLDERFSITRLRLHADEGAGRRSASPTGDYVRTVSGTRLEGGIKIICSLGLIEAVVHSSE